MLDDTEAAALRAQLEAIVKEAEDAKAQAIAKLPASSSRRNPRHTALE
jgi:hypothetical protein